MRSEQDDPFGGSRMTLGEHLGELRRRLVIGLAALAVAFFGSWMLKDQAVALVQRPYQQMIGMLEGYYRGIAEEELAESPDLPRTKYFASDARDAPLKGFEDMRLQAIGPAEQFVVTLKICLYFALFLGSPVLLWELWQFVAAGLYPKERRAMVRYFPFSVVLFLLGVLFGYFGLVPYGMYYLSRTAPIDLIRPDFRIQDYFSFLTSLCLALGLIFQLPIVMIFLARLGLVSPTAMAKYRGYMVVGSFVVAAVLTPPDPITQLMMALPIIALYEIGIWSARLSASST